MANLALACNVSKLMTTGVTWPNVTSLEYPDNNSNSAADHVTFDVDWKAITTVGAAIPQGSMARQTRRIQTWKAV
jgi:hypothetical protein